MSKIHIHIEELVMHGFPAVNQYDFAETLQKELIILFSDKQAASALSQGGEHFRIDAGQFEIRRDTRAGQLGAQVARSVYRGIIG